MADALWGVEVSRWIHVADDALHEFVDTFDLLYVLEVRFDGDAAVVTDFHLRVCG